MNQTTACTCLPTTHPLASDWKNTPRHPTSPHTSLKFPIPSHRKKKLQTSPGPGTHQKAAISVLRISLETPPLFITLHSTTSLPPSPYHLPKNPLFTKPPPSIPTHTKTPPQTHRLKKTPETALFVPRAPPKNSLPSSVPEMGFSLLGRLVS